VPKILCPLKSSSLLFRFQVYYLLCLLSMIACCIENPPNRAGRDFGLHQFPKLPKWHPSKLDSNVLETMFDSRSHGTWTAQASMLMCCACFVVFMVDVIGSCRCNVVVFSSLSNGFSSLYRPNKAILKRRV